MGVVKVYIIRVGEGFFLIEEVGEIGEWFRKIGGEFGVMIGCFRRCGWFDLNVVKFS